MISGELEDVRIEKMFRRWEFMRWKRISKLNYSI
jgi:hypothetical protein